MYIDGLNILRECDEEIDNLEFQYDFYNRPELLVKKMETKGPFSAKESITASISEVDKMENKGPINIDNETIEVSCIPLEAAIKEIVIINGNSNNITVNVNVFQNSNLYEPSEQIPSEQKPTLKKKQTSLRHMNQEDIMKSRPDNQAFSCDHPKNVMKKLSVAEQKERARQWALKEFGPQPKKKLSVAEQQERARQWALKEFGSNFFSEN